MTTLASSLASYHLSPIHSNKRISKKDKVKIIIPGVGLGLVLRLSRVHPLFTCCNRPHFIPPHLQVSVYLISGSLPCLSPLPPHLETNVCVGLEEKWVVRGSKRFRLIKSSTSRPMKNFRGLKLNWNIKTREKISKQNENNFLLLTYINTPYYTTKLGAYVTPY